MNEFERFALKGAGVSPEALRRYRASIGAEPAYGYQDDVPAGLLEQMLSDRIILLVGQIDDMAAKAVQAQLLFLTSLDPTREISLYVNSPGGMVHAGMGIIDTMELIDAPVATVCMGYACSMGAVVLAAGEPGRRASLRHGRMMIHQPIGGISGQASDIIIEAREMERCRKDICSLLSEFSGQPYDKVFSDMERNLWMNADEARGYGLIDRVLRKDRDTGRGEVHPEGKETEN